jgi:hypothetical protein
MKNGVRDRFGDGERNIVARNPGLERELAQRLTCNANALGVGRENEVDPTGRG